MFMCGRYIINMASLVLNNVKRSMTHAINMQRIKSLVVNNIRKPVDSKYSPHAKIKVSYIIKIYVKIVHFSLK